MKCTYYISQNGRKKIFDSEQQLDSFVLELWKEHYINSENVIDPTLQIDLMQVTEEKIQTITKKIKDVGTESVIINQEGDTETILKMPNSKGATSVITTFGIPNQLDKPLVTPFNLEKYLETTKNELRNKGVPDEEIDKTLDNMQKSWKQLTNYGTEIHALFESLINDNKKFISKELTEEQVTFLTKQFNEWIKELKIKHGTNAKFLTEVPIISDKINETYEKAGIKSINGRIDLLVIDEQGYAHIYDFKVSKKPVGIWEDTRNINPKTWHSTKKLTAGYQLAIYKAILNQYGIIVKTTEIIPIKIDPIYNDDGLIESLDNAYLKKDSIKNRPFTSKQWNNITEILPIKTLMDGINLSSTILTTMSKFVPNYEMETNIQRKEVSVDLYLNDGKTKHIIPEEDPDRKYGKYWIWNKYKKNKKVYCKTEQELHNAISELVQAENKYRGNELSDLADTLQTIMEGYGSIDDLGNDNRFKSDDCKRIFRKYIDNGWTFQNNADFIAAGIFVFTKSGLLEIISISHHPTQTVINLGKGDTLLGATKLNREVDEHKILKATNGNIDLIKVMSLLNGIPDILKSYKVNKIMSCNIWTQQKNEIPLETLFYNFEQLCTTYKIPLSLQLNNFSSILESTINTITDVCGEDLLNHIGDWTFTFSPDDIVQGTKFITEKMEQLYSLNEATDLRDAIRTNRWDFDDPLQLSYMLLGQALNKLNGYEIYIEKDPTKWISVSRSEGIYTGSWINSPGTSPSLNIQSLAKIFSVAETHIRRKELSYQKRISKIINALYDYNRRNSLIGGEVKFFDKLFVCDENGNIDKSFRLKHPNDISLSSAESEFITMFLEIVNNLKFNGNKEKITEAKINGEYYEVPLAIGSTNTQLHNKSFRKVIKTKWDESVNFLKILPQQENDYGVSRAKQKVYNKYKLSSLSRINLIESNGIDGLETNLEKLLRDVIHTYVTEEVMNNYMPMMQGIKIALQYQQQMYGVATEKVVDYINKYIDINVYGKPIMDEQLYSVYKCLSTVKSITSTTALGFNITSGIREMMQGIWINISRTMAKAYGKDQFTSTEVTQAWKIICKQSINNPNVLTLVDALNVEYGMANADPHQIQDLLSKSRSGIKNFNSNTLYICNRVPDMYHRLSLVIAKMIHDGCWDAHSIVDDELIYDFKKDKRFSLLNNPNADKESNEYKKQRSLYTAMRLQFNKEGFHINDGEALPRAYTILESTSIKSFSELCFGNYDRSTQMMIKNTLIGTLMLQFRTFLSAKLAQWVLKPGTYNRGNFKEKFNEDGIRYVLIYEFDENGVPSSHIDLETNVKEGDKWEPYVEWDGRFIEGITYSIFSFIKAFYKLDYKGLKELWKNDTKRANFYLFLNDMIFMSILMWIINAFWLSDNKDTNPISRTMATAMYTSFSDGPIHQVIASMFGDLNPPALGIIKNIMNNTSAMITGDKNAWEAATGTFGALKNFK